MLISAGTEPPNTEETAMSNAKIINFTGTGTDRRVP